MYSCFSRFLVLFITSLFSLQAYGAGMIFVEAESFREKGGWIVDQQYMHVMGSPVLLAHGLGEPVADAVTEVEFPRSGTYRVFVRTRNWAAPWMKNIPSEMAPGKFQISLNEKRLETVFGMEGEDWHWQPGGEVVVDQPKVKLAIHDLTGFDGRIDAILFTADPNVTPPEDIAEIDSIRRRSLGLPQDPLETPEAKEGPFDLIVVGGGISGICTSISAARLGCKVALIQDRPLVGGNNSSDVRVQLSGRMGYSPYPNLGNLVHQIDPCHQGNAMPASAYSDHKKLDAVLAEKNITLYLNTHVFTAKTEKAPDGSVEIRAVVGKNIETGHETKFSAKLFADCTGDGNLGFLVGAEWRSGRESRKETGERRAPEDPDKMVLGASIMWYSVQAVDPQGKPLATEFPSIPWAHQFTHENARPALRGDWDWETGLLRDQVLDVERIRDNGMRAAYGHWAYMKNDSPRKWREKVSDRKLGWVAMVAGKRESRRLLGDVIMQEQDVLQPKDWPDASFVANWPIDLHYYTEENRRFFPGEEFRTYCVQDPVRPFAVPYRTLYSRNVSNLFMAGRCISVTHVVLGTIRVMRTCGMMGEVVGMAASVATKNNTTPRGVYQKHLGELIALMEKGIAPKPAQYWHTAQPPVEPTPPAWLPQAGRNVARDAEVRVSSLSKKANYPASHVNDGKIDIKSNAGRWVSDVDEEAPDAPQWVELSFDHAVEINAFRLVSGTASRNSPIIGCVLQYRDGSRWVDVPGAHVKGNALIDLGVRFPSVRSPSYRLWITDSPGGTARIWELELYRTDP